MLFDFVGYHINFDIDKYTYNNNTSISNKLKLLIKIARLF